MKISVARKGHFCSFIHCAAPGKVILKGDIYVGFNYNRKIEDRYTSIMLRFHPDCWEQSRLAHIADVKKQVKKVEEERVRRNRGNRPVGRPPKYLDRLQAIKLKGRLKYYKKVDNWDKVDKLESELKELEI